MDLTKMFLFLLTLLSIYHAKFGVFNPIQLLRQGSGAAGEYSDCLSWRLAVETNNLRDWRTVPESCAEYVADYMLGKQYRDDCDLVADAASDYAQSVKPTAGGDGKDVWVFDIDETTLSNIPYYNRSDVRFGALPRNGTKYYQWVAQGAAPPVPSVLRLYNTVLSLGFKTVILSASSDQFTKIRSVNLNNAGYNYNWERLIFKGEADRGISGSMFKSKIRTELVNEGFRIVGNIGDQYGDILGDNIGNRTFKVPNPMYYIG
ncbi:hypothetical protein DH2020_041132 [Rehmannia glutinosa]|uniref:Acid phosphatase 1-like n=1 Tax=Rehmannia glutinosa TaxID=99300 RepID=A0ABR0UR27_REHGL